MKNLCKGLKIQFGLLLLFEIIGLTSAAQNPLITGQFTADPSARVFGDSVYIYPSHDILATKDRGREGWFCMEDYHVFSSADLTNWKDHGVIITQNNVPWVKPDSYSMWAPDCIERNGKYYFYFPSTPKDSTIAKGFTIGVAVAEKPGGPFIAQQEPIKGVKGIDPNVFIDKDGQAYLYWSQGNIYGAKLAENMLELESEPVVLQNLPKEGLKEGPYLFERNDLYYLTYPHVEHQTERLEYAVGDHPLGPFKVTGVIMDESPECWTNHHSIINFKNQWYLFYHFNDYSPKFDKARSIRADSLFFETDGKIRKVLPTKRGVGLSAADGIIQIDRYSEAGKGISISLLDTARQFNGWKVDFLEKGASLIYNHIDFGDAKWQRIEWNILAPKGGLIEVWSGGPQGKLLSTMVADVSKNFQIVKSEIKNMPSGIENLYFVSKAESPISVDWIKVLK